MRRVETVKRNGATHDFAAKLRAVLAPILGDSLATEASNNIATGFMFGADPGQTVAGDVRTALEQRLRNKKTYYAEHLTRAAVEEAVAAVQDMQPPMADNPSARPRGFEWNKNVRVYHATMALERVLEEGLRSRGALERHVQATGGGPEASISFTLNKKVALAICLGLRTLSALARGDMLLKQLVVDLRRVAPNAVKWKLDEMRLSLDDIVRMDRGLYRFDAGMGSQRGTRVKMENFEQLHASSPDLFEDVQFFRHEGASQSYAVSGWAPYETVLEMTRGLAWPSPPQKDQVRHVGFEIYKNTMAMGDMMFKEVYDPFFFLTRPEHLELVNDEQIGVVSAVIEADWLCADPDSATALGYDASRLPRVSTFDWARACDTKFSHDITASPPTRDWDEPSKDDTVVYMGKSMNELRVYDGALIRNLREEYPLEDVLNEARDAWDAKGLVVDDPVAWPWFQAQTRPIR